jgi:hypothetical protein
MMGSRIEKELILQTVGPMLAICRLPVGADLPEWVFGKGFWSVTRSDQEISVVCAQDQVPPDVEAERQWRAFRLKGTLDLNLTGILYRLLEPLARGGISVFTLSTYHTDYLLVKEERYSEAVSLLGSICTIEN